MDNVTLNNITASCRKDLSALFIGSGLNQLNIIARYCSDSQIISQVEELTENYHCMLSFLANGGKDEERNLTQEKICKKAPAEAGDLLKAFSSANDDGTATKAREAILKMYAKEVPYTITAYQDYGMDPVKL